MLGIDDAITRANRLARLLDDDAPLGRALATDGPIDRVQIYDTAKNTWSEGPPLPDPVHHHGAVVEHEFSTLA